MIQAVGMYRQPAAWDLPLIWQISRARPIPVADSDFGLAVPLKH